MNPTSHRMSFSFCYCHFISTWKLKTLGRKANHLWCLKCGQLAWGCGCGTGSLSSHLQLSRCPVPLALVLTGAGHWPQKELEVTVLAALWAVEGWFSGSFESSVSQTAYSSLCFSFTGPQENRSHGLLQTLILYRVQWMGIATLTGPLHYPGQNCEKYHNEHLEFWSL